MPPKNLHIDIYSVTIHSSQTTWTWVSGWMRAQTAVCPYGRILFSLKKGTELLIHATAWMNCENIMLNGRSQTQRAHIVQFHLCKRPRVDNSIERKSKWVSTRMERWGVIADGWVRGSFWGDENALKSDNNDGYPTLNILRPLNPPL